ncbi:MAG: hypothetical protein HN727_11970 [Opitutae bacterium]|nr:hypothetical protein [Opitutae bacterium]
MMTSDLNSRIRSNPDSVQDLEDAFAEHARKTRELEQDLARAKAAEAEVRNKQKFRTLEKWAQDAEEAARYFDENAVSLILETAFNLAGDERISNLVPETLKDKLREELDYLSKEKKPRRNNRPYEEGDTNYRELLACIWKNVEEDGETGGKKLANNQRKFPAKRIQEKFLVSVDRYNQLKSHVIEQAVANRDPMQSDLVEGIHSLDDVEIS